MVEEKRRFTRFPFQTRIELSINEKEYEVEKIVNLSIGGCLVSASVDVDPETPCMIKIFLNKAEDGPIIKVGGRIFRSENNTVAVKFTSIDPDSLFHLQNIARFNSSDPDKVEDELERHPGLI